MTGRARGETSQMAKTCKIPKNAKNASKLSKFLGFAARRMLMSIMVSERSLGQDTEWDLASFYVFGPWPNSLDPAIVILAFL